MEIPTLNFRLNRRYAENLPRVLTQAERIIAKFGGPYKLAEQLGVRPSTVYRWTYPKSKGGSDGVIPTKSINKLLRLARVHGIFLTGDDLYPGRR